MGKCIIRKIPTGRGNIYGLEERKKALRQEIKAAAAALDEGYTKEADLEIFSHVAGLLEYEQAGTLFCFVGTSGEIDTVPILEDALERENGGVPKCTARGSWKFVNQEPWGFGGRKVRYIGAGCRGAGHTAGGN